MFWTDLSITVSGAGLFSFAGPRRAAILAALISLPCANNVKMLILTEDGIGGWGLRENDKAVGIYLDFPFPLSLLCLDTS